MGWRPSVVGRPLEVLYPCVLESHTACVPLFAAALAGGPSAMALHGTLPYPIHVRHVCLGLATAETKYSQHQSVTFDLNILDMYGARPGGEEQS